MVLVSVFFVLSFTLVPRAFSEQYLGDKVVMKGAETTNVHPDENEKLETKKKEEPKEFIPTHIETPESVRALYMTSWVAGTPSIRTGILKLIDDTEINSIVIDIKDDTGRISFDVYDPELDAFGSEEIRISDLRELIASLHEKDIYVIGRVAVFQDPYFVSQRPDLAVRRASDGGVWEDRKGLTWIDAGAREVWDYALEIGKEAYRAGFDEINYDYVRFPSDGDMHDIAYPFSENTIVADPQNGKVTVMREFYKYIATELKAYQPYPDQPRPIVSADLFGMTTTNNDDLNIGQRLEDALPYFDYIAPMVYPSHYPTNFIGLVNPAAHPYEVIDYSMKGALFKIQKLKASASTSPGIADNIYPDKIRPWLQDFNLGATYTAELVREQIQATYDNGLDSWMIWDAANTYTKGALVPYWEEREE